MTLGTIDGKGFNTTIDLVIVNGVLYARIGNERTRNILRNLDNKDLNPFSSYVDDIEVNQSFKTRGYNCTGCQCLTCSSGCKPCSACKPERIERVRSCTGKRKKI